MNYLAIILKYIRPLLLIVASFFAVIFLYKKFDLIMQYFKDKSTDIQPNEVPTVKDLSNPKYEISDKIIDTYINDILLAVDGFGTDELALDRVYKHLKSTSPVNTVKLWNSWKNKHYKYNRLTGTVYPIGLGDEMTLYQVLSFELGNNQSEKNALINWTWLFKRAGLI